MSGYQLAALLRDTETAQPGPPARLLAFSGSSSPAHVQHCRASGMDAVLYKPLDAAQLLAVLDVDAAARPHGQGMAHDDPMWATYMQSLQEELQALQQVGEQRHDAALRRHAHRLAGVLGMLGCAALADTATDLQELPLETPTDWQDADRLLAHLRAHAGALPRSRPI